VCAVHAKASLRVDSAAVVGRSLHVLLVGGVEVT
jgi:hypothetical protein